MTEYTDHEIAAIFPLFAPDDLDALARDIKTNGLRFPIILHEGKILDGRNRYRACKIAGVEPRYDYFSGQSPVAFVISSNLQRRHLTDSQKAAVAQDVLPWLEAEAKERQRTHAGTAPGKSKITCGKNSPSEREPRSRDKAASLLGVNPRYVSDAKKIREKAPELFERVRSGDATIADAKREIKREEHAAKVEFARRTPRLEVVQSGPFDIILADPPWRYEHCEANNREIENHYGTATLDQIFSHAPNAKPDSILFLWATAPKLVEAIQVMERWGFTYRSCAVWDKQKVGMGYWWRIQHELLLVGTKGRPGCTPEPARVSSVFCEPRTAHSKKPMVVYEWIESAFPVGLKLEMYCRSPRRGWASWGNEVAQ